METPRTPKARCKYGKEAFYLRETRTQEVPRKRNASPRRNAKIKQVPDENTRDKELEYPEDSKKYGAHGMH